MALNTIVAASAAGGDWTQSIGGLLSGIAALPGVVGGIIHILEGVVRLFTDTGHFIQDAVVWMTNALFPPELQTWFFGTVGVPDRQWDPSQIYQGIFRAVQGPGIVIAGAATAGRVVRQALDARSAASATVFEALPRFLLVVLVLGLPGTGVSPAFAAIAWSLDASMAIARELFRLVLHASLLEGVKPGEGWLSHIYEVVANAGRSFVAVVIGGIPLLILMIYAAFLMVIRTIIIGFCIVTAPMCLATAVFDVRNRFVHWWTDLWLGALTTPVIFAVAIALSITLASSVVSAAVIGPILAFIVMCGGLWFSAKMVHQLSWRHFNHGSALTGFAAGVSTMLGPLHRLANAGFMAEALGANRHGSNRAINFMKRVGLASQGFNPTSGLSPAALAAGGLVARDHDEAADLHATGGPPDIAASLDPQGRVAISGAEQVFSQHAFNAFAHSHTRLVGSLTRDQPFGSISSADRAKLAWARASQSVRAAFADEYLSLWLGGSKDHFTGAASSLTAGESVAGAA